MKTILAIKEQEYAWALRAFPSLHPLLLPLCNKPFIEFLIDFAILAGSDSIRLLSDGKLGDVEKYCEDGSRWGIGMSYGSLQPDDSIRAMLDKNRRFCGDGRIMIINGFTFISYDKRQEYASGMESAPEGEYAACTGGSIIMTGVPEKTETPSTKALLSLIPLDGMASFFKVSMDTLETGAERYVLPGYGGEPGCAIGRNVVMSKSVEIRKPVSIGNNVQLLSGTVIGPSAIIGSNVIIDRNSSVVSSIVLDNTYIGEHLEVSSRIATGNLLNDPASGASIAMEDPHLLSGIGQGASLTSISRKLLHALAALILIALLCIPFLLLWPLLKMTGRWQSKPAFFVAVNRDKIMDLRTVELTPKGALGAIAASISLDRFPMLFRVLNGQLSLIGSAPVKADGDIRQLPHIDPAYRPAVVSYAEAEEWPASGSETAIVEHFHLSHSSPLSDIALTLKAFINRLQEKSTA